jgi:hypothetical protein
MCIYESKCKNYPDKCYRCRDYKLRNIPGEKGVKIVEHKHDESVATSDNSWEDLEQRVADELNNVPDIEKARRSRASGALWFEKGDIQDQLLHPECKERTAEKSFSIKREWLEKALDECKYSDKTMCLPFRFKGDDQVYVVLRNQDLMELITMMKTYMHDNDILRAQIESLRKES